MKLQQWWVNYELIKWHNLEGTAPINDTRNLFQKEKCNLIENMVLVDLWALLNRDDDYYQPIKTRSSWWKLLGNQNQWS